ncbi:MAG: acetyl-CoA carboxylase biotin carboxyl carrier protein [Alphaproteobacteria bacterium]|nr:MAG: acetyl-CoA carboxylase biotin carboxyl carrier protein [Alphaproteobacteria bacterium]
MSAAKFDEEMIRRLATVLTETNLSEVEIEQDNMRVRVARHTNISMGVPSVMAAPAQVQTANAPAAVSATSAANHPGAVKSPMVGTAYAAPEPGKPAFIKVGDRVNKGQTLLIVEAMKVMNPIQAPNAGTVTQILFTDTKPVEFDEVLVVIE